MESTVMNAKDKNVNLGKEVRCFNKTQRNALLVQQRGQCALGTQTPFRWLEGRRRSLRSLTEFLA